MWKQCMALTLKLKDHDLSNEFNKIVSSCYSIHWKCVKKTYVTNRYEKESNGRMRLIKNTT